MSAPVKYVGQPTGKPRFVPEFGCEVGTFVEESGGKRDALQWHVPLDMRGDYRPQDLANYDPQKNYRTDVLGKVLCYAFTQSGERCAKRAVNRYPRCDIHGGRLHPLDKLIRDEEKAANDAEQQSLSRYRQFLAGQLSVDDLEDEELATCGFRASNGSIFKPKNVPREMAQAFTRAIYERAQAELRSLTVEAAQTMGEIMKNKNVEPDIRLKAALSIVERNLGKTPQVYAITDAKAYEEVFDGILSISRDESRRARSVESSRAAIESGDSPIDAEVVEPGTLGTQGNEDGNDVQAKSVGVQSVTGNIDDGSGNEISPELSGRDSGNGYSGTNVDENGRDARLFERNEAILAQTVEIKPFEYDLSNHTEAIKKETQKRYARRALENTPDIPLIVIQTPLTNENVHCEIDPSNLPKAAKPSKTQVSQRKSYTLSDF